MTVESLETARNVVYEDPNTLAVYEYKHVITGKTLWSIEQDYTVGNTLRSQYVMGPVLIYHRDTGWLPQ